MGYDNRGWEGVVDGKTWCRRDNLLPSRFFGEIYAENRGLRTIFGLVFPV